MRVLCPEGFLEISCLDLDLSSVGPYTRRALRKLKVRMRAVQHNVSLKPISDTLQVMLGHCGFEDLRRCVVGLPCKGSSVRIDKDKMDETTHLLEELLVDSSREGDETIFHMVAQVARLWYLAHMSPAVPCCVLRRWQYGTMAG